MNIFVYFHYSPMHRSLFSIAFLIHLIILYSLLTNHHAQAQGKVIEISAVTIDSMSSKPIINVQVINKLTGERFFSDSSGRIKAIAMKTDSLVVTATGYSYKILCFKDSLLREKYNLLIRLNKIQIELPNVNVSPDREFDEIQRDAKNLGYNRQDYVVHGFEVLASPLTAIYQRTSRREKDKQGYAKLMNEVQKRELLREILQKYIDLGIFQLSPADVSPFIDFCNISESMLSNAQEYDIAAYMKSRYEEFIKKR
ncbi:MAG: hypothetical protein H0V65_03465 [Chitinophagales bacterium]|nr:hypothetical protein [Chitinophagales bacterium]